MIGCADTLVFERRRVGGVILFQLLSENEVIFTKFGKYVGEGLYAHHREPSETLKNQKNRYLHVSNKLHSLSVDLKLSQVLKNMRVKKPHISTMVLNSSTNCKLRNKLGNSKSSSQHVANKVGSKSTSEMKFFYS